MQCDVNENENDEEVDLGTTSKSCSGSRFQGIGVREKDEEKKSNPISHIHKSQGEQRY